ncbi:ABC transporter permease [Agrobacterium tumefaciens]|jgi:peptide/nickel transport system permease protein|uniref:ABC transporter, membrane spanning protein (Oligopeptide) n=1 Tax=Agrobacterium tumefaciens str. Kerr 14 TaxID=1183424 RepID=A0A1S7R5K6_AGRTU|nr:MULTISPECIES: ABC transporter permease [Agrobacterium]AYM84435.1 peptide/nickel transport system permease protein [Agrobacterium tumefaciens]MBP2541772.1 peptide/nickel transport system permease protein [Agrobacterium tumefaciens]MDP9789676.1 peptide/nickel transport system permease protein [Agrobacterium tumefaciens]NTE94654.1 ABC transporter permease [Agrobacterium tumefaciens]QAB00428.1 ABC transporter permease [Agrobacterium tumefaciens]
MLAVLIRRLVSLVITLFAVSLIIYVVMGLLPGDPAAIMLGTSASPDTLAALQKQMGLDQPLPLRYLHWLAGVFRGDFGQSYTYGVPVAGLILERLAVTLPLALLAVCLSVAIAIPLGVAAARNRNGALDFVAGLFSHVGIAVPGFWVGLLLIIVFSTTLGWMPAGGFPGWTPSFSAGLMALILPAVALALSQAGVLTRVCRSAVLEVMNEDFVRTARAKGLSERVALWRHAVPNAMIPVVTMIGLQFTFLIAGAVLVENVFNLPGLGRLAYQALTQRDIVVMQSVVLFFSALVIIMNFVVDIAYLLIDPRLRAGAR